MTPKEKALELFNKYADNFNFDSTYRCYKEQSKQCALIAVDEVIVSHYKLLVGVKKTTYKYWQEVKEEITKL